MTKQGEGPDRIGKHRRRAGVQRHLVYGEDQLACRYVRAVGDLLVRSYRVRSSDDQRIVDRDMRLRYKFGETGQDLFVSLEE